MRVWFWYYLCGSRARVEFVMFCVPRLRRRRRSSSGSRQRAPQRSAAAASVANLQAAVASFNNPSRQRLLRLAAARRSRLQYQRDCTHNNMFVPPPPLQLPRQLFFVFLACSPAAGAARRRCERCDARATHRARSRLGFASKRHVACTLLHVVPQAIHVSQAAQLRELAGPGAVAQRFGRAPAPQVAQQFAFTRPRAGQLLARRARRRGRSAARRAALNCIN